MKRTRHPPKLGKNGHERPTCKSSMRRGIESPDPQNTGVGIDVPMFHITQLLLGILKLSNRYLFWRCPKSPKVGTSIPSLKKHHHLSRGAGLGSLLSRTMPRCGDLRPALSGSDLDFVIKSRSGRGRLPPTKPETDRWRVVKLLARNQKAKKYLA